MPFKLVAKVRDGAQVRKRYHPPAAPFQRLLADPRTNDEVRRRVNELRATLDPVRLLRQIRAAHQQLVEIAEKPALAETAMPTLPTLDLACNNVRRSPHKGGDTGILPSVTGADGPECALEVTRPEMTQRLFRMFAVVSTQAKEFAT